MFILLTRLQVPALTIYAFWRVSELEAASLCPIHGLVTLELVLASRCGGFELVTLWGKEHTSAGISQHFCLKDWGEKQKITVGIKHGGWSVTFLNDRERVMGKNS